MAKRQALKELQQRIAKLLQQASSEGGVTASWLGVRLGGQRVLFPLPQSGEIYPMAHVQPLPYAKPWFRGVAALRGQIYGVVDLAQFVPAFSASGDMPEAAGERGRRRLVAISESFGVNVVFPVDALEGLRSRDDFVRSESPQQQAVFYGSTYYDSKGQVWQEINLQALIQVPEFMDIAAEMAAVVE